MLKTKLDILCCPYEQQEASSPTGQLGLAFETRSAELHSGGAHFSFGCRGSQKGPGYLTSDAKRRGKKYPPRSCCGGKIGKSCLLL